MSNLVAGEGVAGELQVVDSGVVLGRPGVVQPEHKSLKHFGHCHT